jgi:pimeloyl-ACP methyl ester carboxylesterase
MQQHVDDLAAVVEGPGRGRAHLVGHSYGAYVALVLALQQPARVASLVLAEPPVIPLFTSFPPRGTEILRLLLTRPRTALPIIRFAATGLQPAGRAARRGDLEGALRHFGSAVLGADRFAAMSAERRAQARDNLSREELLGDKVMVTLEPAAVAALTLPVLLVGGDCSPALFKRLTDHLQRLLPESSRVEIPGASHNLHEDAPDAFNRAVGEFLRRVDQSPVDSR